MKKWLAIFLGIFASGGASPSEVKHEASMGFDLADVEPFLVALEAEFQFGLDVKVLADFAASVPVEMEKYKLVDIVSQGLEAKMEFRVFMDDVNTPDLYLFFESHEVAEAVSGFMFQWEKSQGR